MIELRGIIVEPHDSEKVVKLVVRGSRGDDYTTLEFPSGKPLTKGTIISYLSKKLKVKIKDITIASHVKIPNVK